MKSEITPLIRIGLYILAGWLSSHGLPPQAANIITTDPALLELVAQGVAALVAFLTLAWWRIAKRFGWST
jgi:hypothetical protein